MPGRELGSATACLTKTSQRQNLVAKMRHSKQFLTAAVLVGTDQWITSGLAATTAAFTGRIHGCTRTFRGNEGFFSLAPRAPSIHGTGAMSALTQSLGGSADHAIKAW